MLLGLVWAPTGIVLKHEKIPSREPRREHVALPRPVHLLRCLAGKRNQHDYATVAPHFRFREANFARALRHILHQSRWSADPRRGRESRLSTPRCLFPFGHLCTKRSGFPDVPKLQLLGRLGFLGPEFGTNRLDVPAKQASLRADPGSPTAVIRSFYLADQLGGALGL